MSFVNKLRSNEPLKLFHEVNNEKKSDNELQEKVSWNLIEPSLVT